VLYVSRVYECSWARESIDLALLAAMRRVEGLKVREIGQRLGISRTTVKRGLRKLN
jgi:DNA-binding transcriptional regulator LsrR (DeoR family)